MASAAENNADIFSSDSYEDLREKQQLGDDVDVDEGIIEGDEPCSSNSNAGGGQHEDNTAEGQQRECADREPSSPLGMFGEMRVFRDFFLAAFSDGYHNVCGPESLFPGCGCLSATAGGSSQAQMYSSAKVPSMDYDMPQGVPSQNLSKDIGRTYSSHSQHSRHSQQSKHSQHSHNSQSLAKSSTSQDDGATPAPLPPGRRKRPLAVAVGFKYAEDSRGRPIVITPGNRRMPVRGPRSSSQSAPPLSPASKSANSSQKEVCSSVLMPLIPNKASEETIRMEQHSLE